MDPIFSTLLVLIIILIIFGLFESYFHIKSLNNIPVIVDKNRVNASAFLSKNFDINIIVLDDAFQHRKIKRNMR